MILIAVESKSIDRIDSYWIRKSFKVDPAVNIFGINVTSAIDNDQLSGSIPSEIGNLVNLTYLLIISFQMR